LNKGKAPVVAWLLVVALMLAHVGWLLAGGRLQLDTDVLAMLPQDERQPAVQQATRTLADAGQRKVIVLVGGGEWETAKQAADQFAERMKAAPVTLRYRVSDGTAGEWLGFYAPYRAQLLPASAQHDLSVHEASALARDAVQQLYRPVGMPRVGAWADDPLNVFGLWLAERAGDSRVRVVDGRLSVSEGERHYALLMFDLQDSAFSMSAQQALVPLLDAARAAMPAGIEVVTGGVPLYAAAAATQAEREVHTIGIGSLVGIVVLTLFAFKSIRPRVLVTLSIATGLLAAVSVTSLVFGRLHMITLVFGASLVGVAENYGSNYFASRSGRPWSERWAMLREQAPVMWLAMLTTAIGYALLALTPFPGLRQIAVFSVTGLLAAFVTTLLLFPRLDRGEMPFTRFSLWLGAWRAQWPVLRRDAFSRIYLLGLAAVLVVGGLQLQVNDDIRLLQNAPPSLVAQQRVLGSLMDMPSPAQFFLVRGESEEQLLQREELLVNTLRVLGVRPQAVSDWLPSQQRQAWVADWLGGLNKRVLAEAGRLLGETPQPSAQAFKPLLPAAWLAAPVSEPLRHQWLGAFEGGYASVVLLRADAAVMAKLPNLQSPGALWVDKVAEVSTVMARTRVLMAGVIAASYVLVFAALSWRFGRRAWRALAPTALASALALVLPAFFGAPLQLFNVLALLLILGMGVDYGIFMLEQPARHAIRPWLSVTLAAASTLLAFGLLALSQTPALRAFGLTMLLGIALAWSLTPLFMPETNNQNDNNKT
jgi:predicted exporter